LAVVLPGGNEPRHQHAASYSKYRGRGFAVWTAERGGGRRRVVSTKKGVKVCNLDGIIVVVVFIAVVEIIIMIMIIITTIITTITIIVVAVVVIIIRALQEVLHDAIVAYSSRVAYRRIGHKVHAITMFVALSWHLEHLLLHFVARRASPSDPSNLLQELAACS
jgi:hypothetical protein